MGKSLHFIKFDPKSHHKITGWRRGLLSYSIQPLEGTRDALTSSFTLIVVPTWPTLAVVVIVERDGR